MQAFSIFLFTQGNPIGPERLIRKLSKQITADQAVHEWNVDDDKGDEAAKLDPMEKKHMCVCCYLTGKHEWMHNAHDFGMRTGNDFYKMYVSQG